MGEHTKEPWRAEGDEIYEQDATERPIAHILSSWFEDGPDGFLVATDARRIVACVNACAGIPTYQLTAYEDKPTPLGDLLDTLRSRVAELEVSVAVEAANGKHWAAAYSKWVQTDEAAKKLIEQGERIADLESALAKSASREVEMVEVVECARGLSFGEDWNNGTHAKIYRPKLLAALAKIKEAS